MPKPDKKQRHNKKRTATRKLNSISPIKRLGMANGNVQCWRSGDFGLHGQMQIFIHKQAPGLSGIVCFLIDRGVVGLKDAWFKMGVSAADVNDQLDTSRQRDIEMRKTSVEDARKWVAGGVRWAHDNGMRLPAEWVKCATIIGGIGEWQSEDVSAFVMEFAGHPEDLRQRLIGERFNEYTRRSDIDFVFSDDAPYINQATGDYVDDEGEFENDEEFEAFQEQLCTLDSKVKATSERMMQETCAWLAARNQTASTELDYAWRCVFLATMLTRMAVGDQNQAERDARRYRLVEGMSELLESRLRSEFLLGVTQVFHHLSDEPGLIERAVKPFESGSKRIT